MKRSFIVFLMLFVCSNIFASSIYFPSMPSLSPDGKTIFFSYDGDIFKVQTQIDYNKVNHLREERRKESLQYLTTALKGEITIG